MKKFFALLLIFFAFGCRNRNSIEGKWVASYTLRNEIANPQNPSETAFFLNVKQIVRYEFFEDTFAKTTEQKFVSAERPGVYKLDLTDDDFSRTINNKITVRGEYSISGTSVFFRADEVILSNGTSLDFEEYRSKNQYIGESEYFEDFLLRGDSLELNGINYEKISAE